MKQLACVNLPEFPLQLLMRRHPAWIDLPAVVVDRDHANGTILWSNQRARKFRILPGMRYAAGLSLSSELRAGVIPDHELDEHLKMLTERLRFFSADVEPSEHESGVFWIDASGLSLLYPSLRKWAGLIVDDLQSAQFTASVAVGFSRFGTYAFAKTKSGVTAFEDAEHERKQTGHVAIEQLGFDPKLRDALFKLGIRTVGAFLELPANGIKKRFGRDVFRLYQLSKDELFAPLEPQPPQDPILIEIHLDYPETNLERLTNLIEKNLQSLFLRLSARSEVMAAINIRLRFDNNTRTEERLQPATPTVNLKHVIDLIQLRLGTLKSLEAGIVDVEIEMEGTPATRKQGELFVEKSPRDLEAAGRAFARLRAEFGDDAVTHAVLRDGHLPEAVYTWEPLRDITTPRARNIHRAPLIRRIYHRPVVFSPGHQRDADAQLTAHIDDGSIQETQGPYIVSGGWWQREVHREYYFVRTSDNRSLWMFYDRRRMCWFIHGEVS